MPTVSEFKCVLFSLSIASTIFLTSFLYFLELLSASESINSFLNSFIQYAVDPLYFLPFLALGSDAWPFYEEF